MAKSKAFAHELLQHVLNNRCIANLGDMDGLLPSQFAGSLYLSLHYANPIEASNAVYESNYLGYKRSAVARDGKCWQVTENVAMLCKDVNFSAIEETQDNKMLNWLAIGSRSFGNGLLFWSCQLETPIKVIAGVIPRIKAGTKIVEN